MGVKAISTPTPTPDFGLNGKRAVITGAGRGIGRAAALALAGAGASVTLIARTDDEIQSAKKLIVAKNGSADAVKLDVLNYAAVAEFFATRPAFNILINNAGTNRPKPVTDVTEEDFDAVIDLNLKAAFFVAQHCAKKMIEEAVQGSLIHMGSQMGHVGGADRSLYCASKWAIEGLNKCLAIDLAQHGIRSNTIAPTFIETQLTKPFLEDKDFLESIVSKIKLGRVGHVTDITGAIVFLASDASSLMTGSSVLIDGGWTAD